MDKTFAFLRDPYRFIGKECLKVNFDTFETRILLKKTICVGGRDAAEMFYDPVRIQRAGAAPESVRATLFGKGGVQSLDNAAHQVRKQIFLSLLSISNTAKLTSLVNEIWAAKLTQWQKTEEIVLYNEMQEILTRAVCQWAGVPLDESEVQKRTEQLTCLFDSAGNSGHLKARSSRWAAQRWIAKVVNDVRRAPERTKTAVEVIAWHRDEKEELLSSKVAAVEILNLLRPTVAVSVFIVFVAHALHLHPQYRDRLRSGDKVFINNFVQEVRRFYPFFPAITGKVRENFIWHDHVFKKGMRVILDLYGTNHDFRIWEWPMQFLPERFRAWKYDPYSFIPQGGGDPARGHRCPGEEATIALMELAVDFLTRRIEYTIPSQDLTLDWGRIPAIPKSRFVMTDIHLPKPTAKFDFTRYRRDEEGSRPT